MISMLVAHDLNRVIGFENSMPWHIPEELAYFKKVSMGKAIVMGRKTFESIGRPLPGRLNIVVTRNKDYEADGVEIVHTLQEAIEKGRKFSEEIVIIGGAQLFEMAMESANRIYATVIRKEFQGDTYFPAYGTGWKLVSESEDHFMEDSTPFSYFIYERESTGE
ncbi:dihydrofolate reductase [Sporosarcina sp. Te-1]|uniref:dihydrofolate reductase n=1 Tax=Sporosarcina sp. Te-1 TaxID=2818390 RepID=UPI001A9E4E5B|nr:dihydrofolate reductase [Sporosarcina sp. Te-1]QTD42000.1 dihydrofolate reductase [Sporosarcina sp. Te-1]